MRPTRSALVAQQQWQAGHPAASARRPYPTPAAPALPRWRLCLAVALAALPAVVPLLAAL